MFAIIAVTDCLIPQLRDVAVTPSAMAGFFVVWAESEKSRVITSGPCADEPVYRLTFPAQVGSMLRTSSL